VRPAAYVGCSGFMCRSEVEAALAVFPDCGRQLMVGVLASEKTLAGLPNRWSRRYPKRVNIGDVFVYDPRALNLVHYASEHPPTADDLRWLDLYSGSKCHGFQFNGAWPGASLIGLLRARWARLEETRVVLQLRELNPIEAVRRLEPYSFIATDVLIDGSGGRGVPLSVAQCADLAIAIRAAFPHFGIGIAGGLCAETVPDVAHLIRDGISVDAEGRLRDDADDGGNLVQTNVAAYFQKTAEAIQPGRGHS
jgi:hypothetical protein